MKHSLPLFGMVIAVMVCSTASARIGETLEQCKKRYGKPTGSRRPQAADDPQRYYFEKSGMRISAAIRKSKVVMLAFDKLEKDGQGKPLLLSEKEVETLLEASGRGQKWTSTYETLDVKVWEVKLDNGQGMTAVYRIQNYSGPAPRRDFLLLYDQHEFDLMRKKESERLEGF